MWEGLAANHYGELDLLHYSEYGTFLAYDPVSENVYLSTDQTSTWSIVYFNFYYSPSSAIIKEDDHNIYILEHAGVNVIDKNTRELIGFYSTRNGDKVFDFVVLPYYFYPDRKTVYLLSKDGIHVVAPFGDGDAFLGKRISNITNGRISRFSEHEYYFYIEQDYYQNSGTVLNNATSSFSDFYYAPHSIQSFSNRVDGLLVGNIFSSTNGGKSWQRFEEIPFEVYDHYLYFNDHFLFIKDNIAYWSDNAGDDWNEIDLPFTVEKAFSGNDANLILVYSENGEKHPYLYEDFPDTWIELDLNNEIYSSDLIFAGFDGNLVANINNIWSTKPTLDDPFQSALVYQSIWTSSFHKPNITLHAVDEMTWLATGGGIGISEDKGLSWRRVRQKSNFSKNTIYARDTLFNLASDRFEFSDDLGLTWGFRPLPVNNSGYSKWALTDNGFILYPKENAGYPLIRLNTRTGHFEEIKAQGNAVVDIIFCPINRMIYLIRRLYAVRFFSISHDLGRTFTDVDLPFNPQTLFKLTTDQFGNIITISNKNVYFSGDKGMSWIDITGNLPSSIKINDLSVGKDNHLYIANKYAAIFKSVLPTDQLVSSETFNELTFEDFRIYPNPANLNLYIESNSARETKSSIRISDLNGRILHNSENLGFPYHVDVAKYKTGIYLVTIINDAGISTKKFVKQ